MKLLDLMVEKWKEFKLLPKNTLRYIRDHYEWDTEIQVKGKDGNQKRVKLVVATQNPNTRKWMETKNMSPYELDHNRSGWIWTYSTNGKRVWLAQVINDDVRLIVENKEIEIQK